MPVDPIFEAFGMKRPATGSGKAAGKTLRAKYSVGNQAPAMVTGKSGRAIPGPGRDELSQEHTAEIVVKCRFDGLTGLSIVTDAPSGRGKPSAEIAGDDSVEAFDVV